MNIKTKNNMKNMVELYNNSILSLITHNKHLNIIIRIDFSREIIICT